MSGVSIDVLVALWVFAWLTVIAQSACPDLLYDVSTLPRPYIMEESVEFGVNYQIEFDITVKGFGLEGEDTNLIHVGESAFEYENKSFDRIISIYLIANNNTGTMRSLLKLSVGSDEYFDNRCTLETEFVLNSKTNVKVRVFEDTLGQGGFYSPAYVNNVLDENCGMSLNNNHLGVPLSYPGPFSLPGDSMPAANALVSDIRVSSFVGATTEDIFDPTYEGDLIYTNCPIAGNYSLYGSSETYFGNAVALSGDILVVGEPGYSNGLGQVHFYRYSYNSDSWNSVLSEQDYEDYGVARNEFYRLGYAVAAAGDWFVYSAVGNVVRDAKIYTQRRFGTEEFIRSESFFYEGSKLDYFGSALAIYPRSDENAWLAVGVMHANPSGKVEVFSFIQYTWSLTWSILYPGSSTGALFGCSLAFVGEYLAVGASDDDLVYVFEYSTYYSRWNLVHELQPSVTVTGDSFGRSLTASGMKLGVASKTKWYSFDFDPLTKTWSEETYHSFGDSQIPAISEMFKVRGTPLSSEVLISQR